jgi:hypothetical protein
MAYELESMYKKSCIFNARPLILEMHVFKWFFYGTETVEWIFFSNIDKFRRRRFLMLFGGTGALPFGYL